MPKKICFLYTETNGLHQLNEDVTKKNIFSFARLVCLNYIIGYRKDGKFIEEKKVREILTPKCIHFEKDAIKFHGISQDKAKENGFGIASEPWGNVGQEIASYMRFILMFWDNLPENIAFIHGHEKAWHQEGYRMSYMLRHICLEKFGYASLNAFENAAWRPYKGSKSYFNIIRKYWKLVEPYLGDMPRTGFKEKCCAQFVVSRKRIQARPRRLYEIILEQMTDKKKDYRRAPHGKHSGWDLIHFWEAIWHYIFGEDALVRTRKKYGYGIDRDMESGRPLSKLPERTLKHFIAC